jgi:hypothetical protein
MSPLSRGKRKHNYRFCLLGYEVEERSRINDLDPLVIFEVRQVVIPRDDKVGLAGHGALQDAVVRLVGNYRQADFRVDCFGESF